MELMKFDFTKPTPQAKTLKKEQKIINVLWDRLFESQNESQKKGNRSPTTPLKFAIIFRLQENGAYEIRLHQTHATS